MSDDVRARVREEKRTTNCDCEAVDPIECERISLTGDGSTECACRCHSTTPAVESQPQEVRIGSERYRFGPGFELRRWDGQTKGWYAVLRWREAAAVRRVAELERENAELRALVKDANDAAANLA